MTPEETTLLYILSTLAQTCAALAAFVGAVGLYRLQSLRDEHARNETTLRGLHAAATLNPAAASQQTIDDIVRYTRSNVTERSSTPAAVVENMRRALAEWDAFPKRHRAATTALLVFEAWNLLLIAVSLVGFNYVKFWASSSWTFWGVWGAAIGTVVVTGYSVYAWTVGEDDGGLWKRLLSRAGVSSTDWIMALATVGILVAAIITAVWQGVWIRRQWYTMEGQLVAANNALALTRQSGRTSATVFPAHQSTTSGSALSAQG